MGQLGELAIQLCHKYIRKRPWRGKSIISLGIFRVSVGESYIHLEI